VAEELLASRQTGAGIDDVSAEAGDPAHVGGVQFGALELTLHRVSEALDLQRPDLDRLRQHRRGGHAGAGNGDLAGSQQGSRGDKGARNCHR